MKRAAVVAGAVPILMVGLLWGAPPAQAGERVPVRLVDSQNFVGEPGVFTSNIPGCASGRSYDLRAMAQLRPGVFRGTRLFVCDSGAGTFTVNLSARFGEGGSTGTWSLVAASGSYAGVHGAGRLVGVPTADGIDDTYTGTVTVTG